METIPQPRLFEFQPSTSSAIQKGPLCVVCHSLNFDHYFYKKITRNIRLGTWGEILQSQSCAFCRLVAGCLTANPDRSPRDLYDQIVLSNDVSWELGVEQSPYDRLNSDTYSNKLDLRSAAKQLQDVAHRLVVYVDNEPEIKGYIQYLAYGERNKDDRKFFGRMVDREHVDIRLLRRWLRTCENWHENICEQDGVAGRHLPKNLRLIDVEQRTLVRPPTSTVDYLTLSYVWGTDEMKRETGKSPVVTNRADIQYDSNGAELSPLQEGLPQTIEDAIKLTQSLGFRYLWVDALCIIQDDTQVQKEPHLGKMDAIYNCSALTIAAASGLHADSGIPGISAPRKCAPQSERVKGMHLAAMSPSFTDLENSQSLIWNTRGWTFQEKILAKRILLFTDNQVYYRCSESIWTEEITMETGKLSKSMESRPGKYRWAADRPNHKPNGKLLLLKFIVPQLHVDDQWKYLGRFPDYAAAIREYTQRTLTNKSDVLIAISGVLRTLEDDTGQFISGLPKGYFAQSLLWFAEPGPGHVRVNGNEPSFTWAAWHCQNGVGYDVLDVRMIRTIMVTIRDLLARLAKSMAKMSSGRPSSNDNSSSDSTSSNYADSGTTDSSSTSNSAPSSSSPYPYSPRPPKKKRDWSTRKIVGTASVNVVSCFGWPLAVRDHTVKEMLYCAEERVTALNCEETLAFSTFVAEGTLFKEHENNLASRRTRPDLSKLSRKYKSPLLSMSTVIVQFKIGRCLHDLPPVHADDASVFELVDYAGRCVGEVWTTLRVAEAGRERPLEFLTINWGLSLTVAELDEDYIPRWTFDAAKLPESKLFMSCRSFLEEALRPAPSKDLRRYGLSSAPVEQPSVMKFADALFTARKGEPRPKFLWSTVNMILVEWDGGIARRVGIGRVIFDAWLMARGLLSTPEEVILA